MTNSFALLGCAPEPIIHYLKALGILRLVSQQKDPDARGRWQGNTFYLSTQLTREELESFFLDEYIPSPIVAPWNGGSGFYGGGSADYLNALEESLDPRLRIYQDTIKGCREIISQLGLTEKPTDKQKTVMLALCRSTLPDAATEVMDSLYVLTGEAGNGDLDWQRKFAPIFGSGGNDGRLEFTYTFYKYVIAALSKASKVDNPGKIRKALFNTGSPKLDKDSVGQYHPGGVGGPNSSRGDKDISLVNPWDYIFAFEGAILFAGAASRRFTIEQRLKTEASFPFSVSASAAGWNTIPNVEVDDGQKNRGEIWLPLWKNPSTFSEVSYLFGEGRAQIGRKKASNGVDFARAISSLGVDRGIFAFQRIGMMAGERNGKAHLAISLGTFLVEPKPQVNLLEQADNWLERFRSECGNFATRFRREQRNIEDAIFDFCKYGGSKRMQNILIALGRANQAAGHLALTKPKMTIWPLTLKHTNRWLEALDDNSPEFRIALAIASIAGEDQVGRLRENIEPVTWEKGRYTWEDSNFHAEMTDLSRLLSIILEKRMVSSSKHGLEYLPLRSKLPASVSHVQAYLNGELDEGRVANLIAGLVLLDFEGINYSIETSRATEISSAYALLKLVFLPHPLSWPVGAEPISIRPEQAILSRLRGQDVQGAAQIALRRLHSSGLQPKLKSSNGTFVLLPALVKRLAGALIIPVADWRRLADLTLIKPENEGRLS